MNFGESLPRNAQHFPHTRALVDSRNVFDLSGASPEDEPARQLSAATKGSGREIGSVSPAATAPNTWKRFLLSRKSAPSPSPMIIIGALWNAKR